MAKPEDGLLDGEFDCFWLRELYPDSGATLSFSQAPLESIKGAAVIALDANVLLLPYRLGATSISELSKLYARLARADRIFLPGQAVREFLKNRAHRLRDVLRDLGNQASQIVVVADKKIGFLEGDGDYERIVKLSDDIKKAKSETLQAISRISEKLRTGVGLDPVSTVYRDVFSGRVVELGEDESDEALIKEMRWRYAHSVPPGYKDRDKPDEGIGDLIIWKTLLKIGRERKADLIFVTEDAKGDWWVQSEGVFQPRLELVEEYRRASEGKTIHLMPLSALLELLGAKADAVDEAKKAEEARRQRLNEVARQAQRRLALSLRPDELTSEEVGTLTRAEIAERTQVLTVESRSLFREKLALDHQLQDPDTITSLSAEELSSLYRRRDELDIKRRETHRARRRLDDALRALSSISE
jgi:hypothetical protein